MHYSSSGDPARSLALLWRTRERAGRRGKGDLTVDRIVHAAVEIADTEGLTALSMRRVAQRLNVGTMSLYTHVPGKGELVDAMLDTVYGELVDAEPGPGAWRPRLEAVARQNWELYRRHPWMLQVATGRPVLGPNLMAKYERELSAVDGIGLSDVEMDSVVSLIGGYVEGAARRAVEGSQVEQHTGMTDEQWWTAHAPLLRMFVDGERYPTASRVGTAAGEAHGAAHSPEHDFEFGLERVLDGIDALVVARAAGRGRT